MRLLQLCLLAGGFATTALGGREASLHRHLDSPVQHQPIAVDAAGYAIVDKATHGRISKRWVGVAPSVGLWPDSTVRFCYETAGGRVKLHARFKAAMKLWRAAGLGEDKYKMIEYAEPGASCTSHAERATILVVHFTSEDIMYATPGMPVVDGTSDEYIGPVANLGDHSGLAEAAMTIAHEIGHIWGLSHETKFAGFWSRPYTMWGPFDQAASESVTAFGKTFQTTCKNIIGYDDAVSRVEADDELTDDESRERTKKELCMYLDTAYKYDFAAAEMLPNPNLRSPHAKYVAHGKDSVDFQSIMLYSSSTFSSNGQDTLVGNDGRRHHEGEWPSQADVFGIKTLYQDAEVNGKPAPKLPNHRANPLSRVWRVHQTDRWCQE